MADFKSPRDLKSPRKADVRLLVLGAIGVGKHSLVHTFATGHSPFGKSVEKSNDYLKEVNINGRSLQVYVQIFDSTKAEAMMEKVLKEQSWDGIVFVYSVDNSDSLSQISADFEVIQRRSGGAEFPLRVIGMRNDLDKTVSTEEGLKVANSMGCQKLFETNVADYAVDNNTPFENLIKDIAAAKENSKGGKEKCVIS